MFSKMQDTHKFDLTNIYLSIYLNVKINGSIWNSDKAAHINQPFESGGAVLICAISIIQL